MLIVAGVLVLMHVTCRSRLSRGRRDLGRVASAISG
jgi:hypothetical protein